MNKTLKVVLLVFLGLVALVALAIGLAFTPGVQRWAFHKATAGIPGVTLHADRVLFRPTRVEIDGLFLRAEGTEVKVPTLRSELDLWAFWKRKEIIVHRIEAKGAEVAIGVPAQPADTANQPFSFPGILTPAQLPFPITVGRVELDGKFRFAGANSERRPSGTVKFAGGGLAPGAKFTGTMQAAIDRPIEGSELERVAIDGELSFQETATFRIDAVTVRTAVAARGEMVSGERQIQLAIEVTQPQPGAAEKATIVAELPRSTGVAARLISLQLTHDPARGVIEGDWQVQARRSQLADFLRGKNWPDFDGVSSGKFSFTPASGDVASEGSFTLTTGSLAGVRPELAAVGSLQIDAGFAASRKGDTVSLARLETSVAQGRNSVLKIHSLQPATYDLKTSTVGFAQPASDLLQVEITKLPVAWLKPFLPAIDLDAREISGGFAVGAAADGSRVALRASQPLTITELTYRQGGTVWLERATVSLSPRIEHAKEGTLALIPDFAVTLPAGDKIETHLDVRATGEGAARTIGFAIATRAQLPTLLKSMLPANAGGLASELKIQGAWRGHELALQTVTLLAKRGNGLALAEIETRQPFTVFFDSLTVQPERAADPLARVALSGLPLEWARPWLAGWQISGDLASGEVLVATDGHDHLALETVRPLAFRDLRVAQGGTVYADELQGEIALKARGSSEKAQLETLSMDLRRGSESFLRFAGSGSAAFAKDLQFEANGKFDADAVRLLALPPLAPYATLAHGRLNGEFDVGFSAKPRGKFALRGRELVGREGGVAWGNVAITGELTTADDGTMTLNVPLTVDNAGRKSALLLAATAKPGANSLHATGAVTSDLLYLEDLRALATLARGVPDAGSPPPKTSGPGTGGSAKPAPKSPTPDTQPAWAGLTGRFDVDVKKITGEDYEISDLKSALVIEAGRISLEQLTGRFKEAPMSALGSLVFTPGSGRPYLLNGNFNLPGLDIGAFLKSAEPAKPPVLETVATVKMDAKGSGAQIDSTLAAATGDVELVASKGIFRGLAKVSDKVSMAAAGAQALLGLFGKNDKITDALTAVNEFAEDVREIPFESLVIRSKRMAEAITIDQIEMVSAELRISGTGRIEADPTLPLTRQKQRLELKLFVKGEKAKRWLERGLVTAEPGADGYYAFKYPIVLAGSLTDVNNADFYTSLAKSLGESYLRGRLGM